MVASLGWNGNFKGPRSIGSATIGTAWKDIGTAIKVGGARYLGAYIDLSIANGTDARFRLLAYYAADGDPYYLPQLTEGVQDVGIEDQYVEFTTDADRRQLVAWELDGVVPLVKLQGSVSAGTATMVNSINLVTAI